MFLKVKYKKINLNLSNLVFDYFVAGKNIKN